MKTRRAALPIAVLLLAALLAACGSDGSAGPPTTTGKTGERGWLDGEPNWGGSDGDMAYEGGDAMASAGDMSGGAAETATGREPAGPLGAGSVDDNAEFADYLAYLDRLDELGIQLRDFDPRGRVIVTVTGSNDRPVAGAEVVVSHDGTEVARTRTTADGTIRFLPALHGAPTDGTFEVAVAGSTATAEADSAVAVQVDSPGGHDGPVPVDVLFLLDATGSMGDEIDRLKESIDSVSERIDSLEAAPDVRFAMTLYRDEGDAFVTSSYDFTSDVDAFRSALSDVVAQGGGDYPEAMEEGLAEALAEPAWRDPAEAVQLIFLVADAPPQIRRDVPVDYPAAIRDAIGRGIKVFPIASSSTDDQAEGVFRQVAQATGARFVFLSYGAGGAATGENSSVDSTDYEEMALDDLVVRLVSEELDHLAGGGGGPTTTGPTTTTEPQVTTTTNPPGQ